MARGSRRRGAKAPSSLEQLTKQKQKHETLSRDLHSANAVLAFMLQQLAREQAIMQQAEQLHAAVQAALAMNPDFAAHAQNNVTQSGYRIPGDAAPATDAAIAAATAAPVTTATTAATATLGIAIDQLTGLHPFIEARLLHGRDQGPVTTPKLKPTGVPTDATTYPFLFSTDRFAAIHTVNAVDAIHSVHRLITGVAHLGHSPTVVNAPTAAFVHATG